LTAELRASWRAASRCRRAAREIHHCASEDQQHDAPPQVDVDAEDQRALDRAAGDQDHAVEREQQAERKTEIAHRAHQNSMLRASVSASTAIPTVAGRVYHA